MNVKDEKLFDELMKSMTHLKRSKMLPNSPTPLLTDNEARILSIIYRHRDDFEAMRPRTLSYMARLTAPALSPILKSLTKNGYVERVHRKDDYRAVYLTLTEEGERLAAQIDEAFRKRMIALVDFIGEEDARTFLRILEKLNEFKDMQLAHGEAKIADPLRDMNDEPDSEEDVTLNVSLMNQDGTPDASTENGDQA